MEALSWLTQSRRFIRNNLLQRYLDNVRYSEETRLRSVSKSFLAVAYPRFESPDTSKDPKRGARVRVFREQILLPSPYISPLWLSPSLLNSRCASVNLHRHASNCIRVHHFVYLKPSIRRSFSMFIQRV